MTFDLYGYMVLVMTCTLPVPNGDWVRKNDGAYSSCRSLNRKIGGAIKRAGHLNPAYLTGQL